MTTQELEEKLKQIKFELMAADAEFARISTNNRILLRALGDAINAPIDSTKYETFSKIIEECGQ